MRSNIDCTIMAEQSPTENKSVEKTRRGNSVYSTCRSPKKKCASNFSLAALLGPPPNFQLGPKACIRGEGYSTDSDKKPEIFSLDPCNQFLHWKEGPKDILLIKKINDRDVTKDSKELTRWLIEEKSMNVFVEAAVLEEEQIKEDDEFVDIKSKLCVYEKSKCNQQQIDLIICLGGDGTLLHASSLFQESCPPVISFHLGTLGFLMPFSFTDFKTKISQTLHENIGLTLRARLKSQVLVKEGGENIVDAEQLILNEVVVDRGPVASLVYLDIHCNGQHLTTLIGDGLVISTATGSTAYAAATGASMVHPSVPGIILTPICPHSLSFRPIVVPAGIELKVSLSPNSRRNAWASFDGRNQVELDSTKTIRITTSVYPLPCISHKDHLRDWFDSLAECLQWNTRDFGERKYSSNGDT